MSGGDRPTSVFFSCLGDLREAQAPSNLQHKITVIKDKMTMRKNSVGYLDPCFQLGMALTEFLAALLDDPLQEYCAKLELGFGFFGLRWWEEVDIPLHRNLAC